MYGLVLEGGGAKGAYQIGAYRALQELGLEIKGVSGTSIGALNGAMIVQGDGEKAYDLWYNLTPTMVFDVEEELLEDIKNFDLNQENIVYLFKKARDIINNRGLDISPVKKILESNINEKLIRETGMDFGFVTVNLSKMRPLELFLEDIPAGQLVNYLIASAYLPVFKLEKLDGRLFLDGGFYNNLPITMLGEKGYDNLIAIRTYGLGRTRKIPQDKYNITYINPGEDLGGILDFSQEKSRRNLKMGYYDAQKLFKGLAGNKYYLQVPEEEDYYLHFLTTINREKITLLGKLLSVEKLPYRRLLFEFIIPRLTSLLELEKDCSYQEVVIALLEKAALKLGLERFKIYQLDEFIELITQQSAELDPQKANNIPKFIRHNDLLSRTVREDLLDEILSIIFNK